MSDAQSKYESGEYQSRVGDMVSREVAQNVSTLVSELAANLDYEDNLLEIMLQDDFAEPGEYRVNEMTRDECVEYLEALCIECRDNDTISELREAVESNASDDWQAFCDEEGLDPHQNEALEHWIISPWLAKRLELRGEMIVLNFLGLTIWGRTCSGQSILLDKVICDIYDELNPNSFAVVPLENVSTS